MRSSAVVIAMGVMLGCAAKAPQEMVQAFDGKALHTCCNIYHEEDRITDANYREGSIIPVGTAVRINGVAPHEVTFVLDGGQKIRLEHLYGREQQSSQQYFEKMFVAVNRGEQVDQMPPILRKAIRDGRVEKGMKRPEVVLSLGYPPTDDNPSPTAEEWTYWYGKGQSYKIRFDSNGYVSEIIGRPAPTRDKPVRVYRSELEQ